MWVRGKPAFSVPNPSPTRQQVIADFIQWARANPIEVTRPPVDGVFEFLTKRFPCPNK
jgi:Rap1a immunity proteins